MNEEQIENLKYQLGCYTQYQEQLAEINKPDAELFVFTDGGKKVAIVGALSVQIMELIKQDTKNRLGNAFVEMVTVLNNASLSPYQ